MNKLQKFRSKASALVLGGTAMVASAVASATPPAAFDPSSVTSKITEYGGYGIVILGAFAVAAWTLKAMGLIGGRR